MKKWIYFGCVVTSFALTYTVDVKLSHAEQTNELFYLDGSRISYLICFFASTAALSVLLRRPHDGSTAQFQKLPRWSELPKWPFLAFIPLLATSGWSRDGFPAREGVITIQHGWFKGWNLGPYFAFVVTIILVELALRSRPSNSPAKNPSA